MNVYFVYKVLINRIRALIIAAGYIALVSRWFSWLIAALFGCGKLSKTPFGLNSAYSSY